MTEAPEDIAALQAALKDIESAGQNLCAYDTDSAAYRRYQRSVETHADLLVWAAKKFVQQKV